MHLIDGPAFVERLRCNSEGQSPFLFATLELTTRCCLNCVHCYSRETTSTELGNRQWKNLLDRLCADGCIGVHLTGGSPLIRNDFEDLYLHAKRSGLLVTILSNGILLNDRKIGLLSEYPPTLIDITVYGSSEAVYQKVTGVSGAFARLIENLDKLRERHIPFSLKTMILKENAEDVDRIAELARSYGVKFRTDPVIDPCRTGINDPFLHRVDPKSAAVKERLSADRCDLYDGFFAGEFRVMSAKSGRFHCLVEEVQGALFIRADGRVAPCAGLSAWAIDIVPRKRISLHLEEFWRQFNQSVHVGVHQQEKCADCAYSPICSYCTARALVPGSKENEDCMEWYFPLNHHREKLSQNREAA